MKGDEFEIYEPKFTSHGFRYLEISGLHYAPEDGNVARLVVHNDAHSRSSFQVNEAAEVLNKINAGSRNGISGNLQGGPGSCGARDERGFFTGDTSLAAEASFLHFDLAAIYTHWLQTAADGQRPKGAINHGAIGDYAPDIVGDTRDGTVNWGGAFVTVPWTLWHHYGDTDVIRRNLPQLEAYMAFLEVQYDKTAGTGLKNFWPACLTWWIVIGPQPSCSLSTAFGYVNNLRMMAEMTEAINAASASTFRARWVPIVLRLLLAPCRVNSRHSWSFFEQQVAGPIP